MGYYIKSKKINMVLNKSQQERIYKTWSNFNSLNSFNSTLWMNFIYKKVKESYNKDITAFLDAIGFEYEKKGERIKIKSIEGKMNNQSHFFKMVEDIITPGNYITLRGEDGAIFGWFFNQELKEFNNYKELRKLKEPFEFYKMLDKTLEIKNNQSHKPKI